MSGQIVWITDADSPGGKALLLRMAAEGASLLLGSDSGGRELESELAQVRQAGSQAFVYTIDDWRSAEVAQMLAEAAKELGPVDVLIHNRNLVRPISVENGEEDVFREVMNANAKSAFVCAKEAGKQMTAREAGKIIFVGSIHAEKPTGMSFAYSASKGAVKMLAREAAVTLGRHGIEVYSIELGPAEGDDDVFRSDLSGLYDSYRYKVPNAVLGTHEDLAELALFLASGEARYLNGTDIRMDGGFLLHYLDFKMKRPAATGGDAT
nr:SDR family oxidoreductase [Cohnella zeiphila]